MAVLLSWFKCFYWLRLFGPTSFYIRLITETVSDARYFIILFFLILMTFGNAVLILSQDRELPLYRDYFGSSFLNAALNQYELSLGEFDTEDRFRGAGDGGDDEAWIIFIVATMITQIMFLNMLIAIMGDTFDRVTESRAQSALVEKIRILADYVYVVPRESAAAGTMSRFLFVIRPKSLGADELGSWEGTASILKASVEANVKLATKTLSGKIAQLQAEMNAGHRMVKALDERMGELHATSQRQLGLIEGLERRLI